MADPSARLPFERLADGDRFAFYSWRSILISYNGAQATDAYFKGFEHALERHLERHEQIWMYSIHRIERVTAQPSSDARKRSAELLKRTDPKLQANVMVFDVRGMTGAIIRTFVSGVFLLTRSRVENKVCDDPVEGLEWLRDLDPTVPGLAEDFAPFRNTVLTEADRILGPSPRR